MHQKPLRSIIKRFLRDPDGPPGPNLFDAWLLRPKSIEEANFDLPKSLIEEYGDFVCIPGLIRTYFLANPDAILHILQNNAANYRKQGSANKRLQYIFNKSYYASDTITTPCPQGVKTIFSSQSQSHMLDTVQPSIDIMLDACKMKAQNNKAINISAQMANLSCRLALRTLLHAQLDNNSQRLQKKIAWIIRYFDEGFHPLVPSIRNARYHYAQNYLNKTIEMIVRRHKDSAQTNNPLIEQLLQSPHGEKSDHNAVMNLKTMFILSYSTTHCLLAWTFYCLSLAPQWQDMLRTELLDNGFAQTFDLQQFDKLSIMNAVVNEVLRLYPPIWRLLRLSVGEDKVNQYFVQKGAFIDINLYHCHRHPDYWQNPDMFNPNRFIDNPALEDSHCFFPFGAGPQACFVKDYVLLICKIVISRVLLQYRLTYHSKALVKPAPTYFLTPQKPIWTKLICTT